jgi:hypothetical protein
VCDPIVALLDIRPEYVFKEFGPELALLETGELETLRHKIESVGGQRLELNRVFSCPEIGEYSSGEAVSMSIELCGAGEEIEVALCILMAPDTA